MFEPEKRAAMRLLQSIEDNTLSEDDIRHLIEGADPALVYLVFGWLRHRYHGGHSASEGVLGRIVGLCRHPSVAKKAVAGEKDAIAQWFEETHEYGDFRRGEFIDLIVEKLEG